MWNNIVIDTPNNNNGRVASLKQYIYMHIRNKGTQEMKHVKNGDVLDFDMPSMVVSCCRCRMKHTIQLDEVEGRPVLRYFLWDDVPAKSEEK